jgi:hypothetical protein
MTTAEIREKLTRTFSIANGAFPKELSVLVATKDYTDASGNVIAYANYAFTEETIKALNDAGITEVTVAPENPTEIACAQLCGLGHYRMRGFMTVQTQEEYDAWLTEQESYIVLPEATEASSEE